MRDLSFSASITTHYSKANSTRVTRWKYFKPEIFDILLTRPSGSGLSVLVRRLLSQKSQHLAFHIHRRSSLYYYQQTASAPFAGGRYSTQLCTGAPVRKVARWVGRRDGRRGLLNDAVPPRRQHRVLQLRGELVATQWSVSVLFRLRAVVRVHVSMWK